MFLKTQLKVKKYQFKKKGTVIYYLLFFYNNNNLVHDSSDDFTLLESLQITITLIWDALLIFFCNPG